MGAAHGLAEWGDSRAFKPLWAYIEDAKNNEHGRMAACEALPWVAPKGGYERIVENLLQRTGGNTRDDFVRLCLAEALTMRPYPSTERQSLRSC